MAKKRVAKRKSFKSANKHCDSYNAGNWKVGGAGQKNPVTRPNEMYSLLTFDSSLTWLGNKKYICVCQDVYKCRADAVRPVKGVGGFVNAEKGQPGSSLCYTKPCSDFGEGKLVAFHSSRLSFFVSLFVCLLVSFRFVSPRAVPFSLLFVRLWIVFPVTRLPGSHLPYPSRIPCPVALTHKFALICCKIISFIYVLPFTWPSVHVDNLFKRSFPQRRKNKIWTK